MTTLHRYTAEELGDSTQKWRTAPNYKDIYRLLCDVHSAVRETGNPVVAVDAPEFKLIGFHMYEVKGDLEHWWAWNIHLDDLKASLPTNPGCEKLVGEALRTTRGRANVAAWLSGKLPYNDIVPQAKCLLQTALGEMVLEAKVPDSAPTPQVLIHNDRAFVRVRGEAQDGYDAIYSETAARRV